MELVLYALTAPIVIFMAWAGLRVAGIGNLRQALSGPSMAPNTALSLPSLEPPVVTLGSPDLVTRAKDTPDEAPISVGRASKQTDPYRDIRKHLLAAVIVIAVVAALGSFLLLQ